MLRDRMIRAALFSFAGNLLYAGLHGILGITGRSWWYISLCAYYIVLSVMRLSLLLIRRHAGKNAADAHFASRFTGGMFLGLAVCFAGTVILSTVTDRGTKYHLIVMLAQAVWVFTRLTLAIVHLVRARKSPSPVIRALRNISLADAFVSLCALQRSMLVTFPGMSAPDIRLMNALTGTGVSLLILVLGLNLIGGRRINMAKAKIVKVNEKIAETVVKGYKTVENAVVDGYKTVENAVVDGYKKMEDKFVEKYLTREGETVEEAKERMKGEN